MDKMQLPRRTFPCPPLQLGVGVICIVRIGGGASFSCRDNKKHIEIMIITLLMIVLL